MPGSRKKPQDKAVIVPISMPAWLRDWMETQPMVKKIGISGYMQFLLNRDRANIENNPQRPEESEKAG